MSDARDPEEILAEWLERLDAEEGGDFADLLARHPGERAELERLYGTWRKLQALDRRVQPVGDAPDDDGPGSDPFSGPGSLGPGGVELRAGERLGHYELRAELGRGGMGVVWRARDLMLGEEVALKFLPHVLAADRLSMLRLRREAKVLLSLTHLAIVRLRTVEVKHGLTFLVEECLGGPTLEEVVEARLNAGARGIGADEALWILEQVAPALDYAHAEGVTHRDLKPSNLMLDRPLKEPAAALGTGTERIKLCDFGLAFVATSALTQISGYRPSGTLPFMSPEVLMGRKPTPAADLYSLGATLHALVSGEPPFTHGDIATQVLHRAPDPLESGDPHLDAAVASAMAKSAAERPTDAAELLALARGEIHARPPARSRRRTRLVLAAAVLGVALAGGGAWAVWGPDESEPEHGEQREVARAGQEPSGAPPEGAVPAGAPPVEIELEPPFDDTGGAALLLATGSLEVRGRVLGARAAELAVFVNSVRNTVRVRPDGGFDVSKPLVAGREHEVRIEAEGAQPLVFRLSVDVEPPRLEPLVPPATVTVTDADAIDLRVRATDEHLAGVRLGERPLADLGLGEGQLADLGNGEWGRDGVALEPGPNELEVTARDRAGHESTLRLTIQRTTHGPELAAAEPAPGATLHLFEPRAVRLSFPYPIERAALDGAPLVLEGGGRAAAGDFVPRSAGDLDVAWSATDRTGAEAGGTLRYRVEVRPRAPALFGRELEVLGDEIGWARWARRVRDPETGITLVLVDPGAYRRGAPPENARLDEGPWHEVRVTRPFYLAETEVTRAQWRRFALASGHRTEAEERGSSLSRAPGGLWQECAATWSEPLPEHDFEDDERHPVTQISWRDAALFCESHGLRLPTEAEWEYACRAGTRDPYWWGSDPAGGERRGNFADVRTKTKLAEVPVAAFDDGFAFTAPVGSFEPNAWGLYDMLGNVWEWCDDAYDPTAYEDAAGEDPLLAPEDEDHPRVLRGGSWLTTPSEARCARRAWDRPGRASDVRGFRPAFTP